MASKPRGTDPKIHGRRDTMKKEFSAVVRHYHIAKRLEGSYSYSGLLKEGHDLDGNVKDKINKYLRSLPDGERVKITIEGLGKAASAHGFVWAWTKPHTYERILETEYRKMVEMQKTYKLGTIPGHFEVWHEDVTSINNQGERT